MKTRYLTLLPIILAMLSASLCSCERQSQSESATNAKSATTAVFRSVSRVEYQYEGILGVVGVPSKATAYAGDTIAARAEVKFDGNLEPGSLKTLEVEETHYDAAGNTIYRGKILFQIQFTGYIVQTETPIEGTRPLRAFGDWPSSH
jgi:hypothetical protein